MVLTVMVVNEVKCKIVMYQDINFFQEYIPVRKGRLKNQVFSKKEI
jgi:hypothetical protein